MEYIVTKIKIKNLISLYNKGLLNLNPPYQRNAVWDNTAKKLLIDTIINNYPLPNIFLHETSKSKYDMVDGQQRTRTILAYYKNTLADQNGIFFADSDKAKFLNYEIPLVRITKINSSEKIESFYARVNSSGKRLNRPELLKAKYFDTKILQLADELSCLPEFDKLNLFSESSQNRMNDLDFTAELIGNIKFGRTDKKLKVDDIFEKDLTDTECIEIKEKFVSVINRFVRFNNIHPINKTRYRQRNDFYTLFDFLRLHTKLPNTLLDYVYNILINIDNDIYPSNEDCAPFKDYALHCVSQSNSKSARDARYNFMKSMFLNAYPKQSSDLKDVLFFYGLNDNDIIDVNGYSMIELETLRDAADI